MELYTSLVRLKQAMNGGQLPPMTPLPEYVKEVIDPAYTINGDGWGGLVEDEARGLRCPVRSCGQWHHMLKKHWNESHRDIGGAKVIAGLMSIPETTRLASSASREAYSRHAKDMQASGKTRLHRRRPLLTEKGHARRQKLRATSLRTINSMNLRDSCPEQIRAKIIALHHKLGRSPIKREFQAEYGNGIEHWIRVIYGTWNNAIVQCGLRTTLNYRYDSWDICEALKAWYEVHGELPRYREAGRGDRAPLLPSPNAIRRAFNGESWDECMRRAAAILNIYGGRYGLPERKEAAA